MDKERLEAIKKIIDEPVNDTGSSHPGDMGDVINQLADKVSRIGELLEDKE